MKNFIILSCLLFVTPCISAAQTITTDDLEQRYGRGNSGGSDNNAFCLIVDYNAYDEAAKKNGLGLTVQQQKTFLSIVIKNISDRERYVDSDDIEVLTAKGNVVSPTNRNRTYISPGQSVTLSGLTFKLPISQVNEVKIKCY